MRTLAICHVVIFSLLFASVSRAAEVGKGAMEYFTANPEGRLLAKVQVWGDVAIPGMHYVPDDTSLLTLIGIVGGPRGALSDARVKLHRESQKNNEKVVDILAFTGEEVLSSAAIGSMKVQSGDVLYVEATPASEGTMRTLTLVSALTGAIASVVLTFVLLRQQK